MRIGWKTLGFLVLGRSPRHSVPSSTRTCVSMWTSSCVTVPNRKIKVHQTPLALHQNLSLMSDTRIDASGDWLGVEDPWVSSSINLVALQGIVCQVLRVPSSQCGPPVAIGLEHPAQYARVYSFQLPNYTVVARVVAPVKPLFKTESEVAAMDFVRSMRLYGSLPSSLR